MTDAEICFLKINMENFNSDQKLSVLKGLPILSGLCGSMYQATATLNQFANASFIGGDKTVSFAQEDLDFLDDLLKEFSVGALDIVSAMQAGNEDGIVAIANSTNTRIKDMIQQFFGKNNEA